MKPIRKAVFPVAGFGSRFLPATKAMPKGLLPIVYKPFIQYAPDEAIAAGIDTLIFMTGRNKRTIEDHFDNRGCPPSAPMERFRAFGKHESPADVTPMLGKGMALDGKDRDASRGGGVVPNSSLQAIRPGISVSAMVSPLLPKSA